MSKTPASTPRRITLHDIAREVGVSHVSVSLALRDSPRISAACKAEIKATAERLGYRPDPMLSALARYRFENKAHPIKACIAWLNQWPSANELRKFKEFDGYWRGASEVAQLSGYNLEEFIPGPKLSLARIEKILIARGITGIIIPPAPSHNSLGKASLDWGRFSAVCFGHSFMPSLPVHLITADQVAATSTAFRATWGLGYRKIGYVTRATSLRYTMFLEGYLRAQVDVPARHRLKPCLVDDVSAKDKERQIMEWYRRVKPDAILTELGDLRKILEKNGVSIPADVGLATTSVLDGNANAGINQNSVEIGRVAMETLISLINSNHKGIPRAQRQVLVEGYWVDGDSMPSRV